VTSEEAWPTISFSLSEEFAFLERRMELGVEVPDCRFEKRSSRSFSFARSALRFAVSCARRYCARELYQMVSI
jgi:hypothetical protein